MEKYLVIILVIILIYSVYKCWNLATVTTEGFADATPKPAEVPTNVDTNNSIATLAQLAKDLQEGGGLKVPGTLISPTLTAKSEINVKARNGGGGYVIYSQNDDRLAIWRAGVGDLFAIDNGGTLSANNARISKFYKASGPDSGGIEFMHDNSTQGIGLGYNTIYAAGTNPDQDLGLKAKGSGAVIINGRNILTELDALKATNATLRADLDARTKYIVNKYGDSPPDKYTEDGMPGGNMITGNGHAHWARRQ